MNFPKKSLIQFTIPIFLLVFVCSCNRKITTDNSINKSEIHYISTPSALLSVQNKSTTFKTIDKNIRCIFQDKKGNYWFGTNSAGVYRYNSKTLTQFTTADGLSDNQVINIQEDDLGNIWFGTGLFGVCNYDGSKFETNSTKFKTTKGSENDWKSNDNDLWFNAAAGVFLHRNGALEYLPFDSSSVNPASVSPIKLSSYSVYSILKDKNGNLWFGTQAEGVCRFDGKKLSWFKEKGLAGPAVLGIFEDSKGIIWFGNNGSGLFQYDGNTLTNFTKEMGLNNEELVLLRNLSAIVPQLLT
jgi:ligand-binding sensor domain-containing protein